jgi:hypothetical protein
MSNIGWSNDNDEHRRSDSELEAIYDAKREKAEFEEEKHRVYIGDDKAILERVIEPTDFPGKLYPEWELEISDGDHMRVDEQPFEVED